MDAERTTPRGGGLVAGRVVLEGDVVRRPAGPWSPSVHLVLRRLRDLGADEVPEPLGVDGGVERLRRIGGTDQGHPLLPTIRSVEGARRLGALAARLSHLLQQCPIPADARWQGGARGAEGGPVLQHGDLGPWNLLWTGEEVVGVLDWELLEPAEPDADLGFLAWHVLPMMDDDRAVSRGFEPPVDRGARLAAYASGAGRSTTEVLGAVLAAQSRFATRTRERGRREDGGRWGEFLDLGLDRSALADRTWTQRWIAAHADGASSG